MPELPEVETIRQELLKQLITRQITAIKILRQDSISYPSVNQFIKSLVGKQFFDISRQGKYLLFTLKPEGKMIIHLRMSGRLLILSSTSPAPKYARVIFLLDNGFSLIFDDLRVFGRLWYIGPKNTIKNIIPSLTYLGPEPLHSLDPLYLKAAFKEKRQAIKSLLLDQTVIAGIGNIYADESLHCSGLHPKRPANSLNNLEITTLIQNIQTVLRNAIHAGGSSIRDYTNINGVNGNYQHKAWVYGRAGLPCHKCQSLIQRLKLASRSSYFCPKCQK